MSVIDGSYTRVSGLDAKDGIAINGSLVINGSGSYVGDIAAPAGSIGTTELAANAVTLAKLATGITPSHVVKFAGTVTWSGSGASLATTVAGVAATDIVVASFLVTPTQAAYVTKIVPTTNTITITLSAANTANDAQISYVVYRAAA